MIRPVLTLVASAALLTACNERGASPAVDKAQDMAAAPVGQMSAATLGANSVPAYVSNAAEGDMYEIQAADIALERSQNAQVKQLAQMIKADHTAASTKFKTLVPTAAPEVTLPTELDQRRQGLLDNLKSASAADFDRVYLDQQIAAHQEAVTLHEGFQDNAEHPALAGFAREVLPKIRAHLEKAQQLKAAM